MNHNNSNNTLKKCYSLYFSTMFFFVLFQPAFWNRRQNVLDTWQPEIPQFRSPNRPPARRRVFPVNAVSQRRDDSPLTVTCECVVSTCPYTADTQRVKSVCDVFGAPPPQSSYGSLRQLVNVRHTCHRGRHGNRDFKVTHFIPRNFYLNVIYINAIHCLNN